MMAKMAKVLYEPFFANAYEDSKRLVNPKITINIVGRLYIKYQTIAHNINNNDKAKEIIDAFNVIDFIDLSSALFMFLIFS